MAHEGQLWEMALEPFGSDELLQVVLDMWKDVGPPPKPVVEHLTTKQVSQVFCRMLPKLLSAAALGHGHCRHLGLLCPSENPRRGGNAQLRSLPYAQVTAKNLPTRHMLMFGGPLLRTAVVNRAYALPLRLGPAGLPSSHLRPAGLRAPLAYGEVRAQPPSSWLHQRADAASDDSLVVLDFVEMFSDCAGHRRRALRFSPSRELPYGANDRGLIAENCIAEGGGDFRSIHRLRSCQDGKHGTGPDGFSWACLCTPNGLIQKPKEPPQAVLAKPLLPNVSSWIEVGLNTRLDGLACSFRFSKECCGDDQWNGERVDCHVAIDRA